ncbi:hypothetical protein Ccrd_000918, partial [Cynara cardunculus var. scolymus]
MTFHSPRKRFRRLTVFINDQARFTLLSRDSQIPHDSADFVEFVWSDSSDSGLTCEAIQAIQAILWRFSKATTFGGSNIDPTAWEEKNCKEGRLPYNIWETVVDLLELEMALLAAFKLAGNPETSFSINICAEVELNPACISDQLHSLKPGREKHNKIPYIHEVAQGISKHMLEPTYIVVTKEEEPYQQGRKFNFLGCHEALDLLTTSIGDDLTFSGITRREATDLCINEALAFRGNMLGEVLGDCTTNTGDKLASSDFIPGQESDCAQGTISGTLTGIGDVLASDIAQETTLIDFSTVMLEPKGYIIFLARSQIFTTPEEAPAATKTSVESKATDSIGLVWPLRLCTYHKGNHHLRSDARFDYYR